MKSHADGQCPLSTSGLHMIIDGMIVIAHKQSKRYLQKKQRLFSRITTMKTSIDISSADLAAHAEALVKLTSEKALLPEENDALKRRVAWFENQLFGQKSEKRPQIDAAQLSLLGDTSAPITEPEGENEHITYIRKQNQKQRPDDCVNDNGLRSSDKVPVKIITIIPDELKGHDADLYEVIGTKSTFRLSQRPASFVVL